MKKKKFKLYLNGNFFAYDFISDDDVKTFIEKGDFDDAESFVLDLEPFDVEESVLSADDNTINLSVFDDKGKVIYDDDINTEWKNATIIDKGEGMFYLIGKNGVHNLPSINAGIYQND